VATFKTGKSAAEDNVLEGVTLAGELDESPNAAIAKLTEWLGEPTLAMQSGGEWINPKTGEIEPKLHTHWRLKVPARTSEDLRRLKEARALLVHLVDGDPTAAPVCHPLRWAGSWHTKGEPRLATIVSESDNEIDLAEAPFFTIWSDLHPFICVEPCWGLPDHHKQEPFEKKIGIQVVPPQGSLSRSCSFRFR